MDTQRVSIIIINWNSLNDTIRCLESIRLLDIKSITLEIIVVDNASSDTSVVDLKKQFPEIVLIPLQGFTGGNNIGIKYALENKAEYIWLLNNDTTVHPNSLKALLHSFQDPSVGISGSKIYFMKNFEFHKSRYSSSELGKVIWYAGGVIDWDNIYGSHRGVDEVDNGQYDTEEETQFVTGCSLMISRECLKSTGGFDDKYFAYLEDMDLSVTIQRSGYKVMYIPDSIVWHKNAGSTGGPGNIIHQYYMTRNRLLFGWKYASFKTKFALLRESFRFLKNGTDIQKQAVKDAFMGKWGKKDN
jgi:GT2 family glycosyltransferase